MLNRDEFDTFLVFVIKVYLFEFFIPMYDMFTCLGCLAKRELATVQVFEMFTCLRSSPESESWSFCKCWR